MLQEYYAYVAKWEGGYVNHPNDPGGETNRGITYNTFKALASKLGIPNTYERFRSLSFEDFSKFVKSYWDLAQGDAINDKRISALLTDITWGSGESRAKKILATVLKLYYDIEVKQDGNISPADAKIINDISNSDKLFDRLHEARESFLKNLAEAKPNLRVFLKGWLNRTSDFYNTFKKKVVAADSPPVPAPGK
jgi:lysozyme family protein